MRFTIRMKILFVLLVMLLSALFGYIMFIHGNRVLIGTLKTTTEAHIKALVREQSIEIEAMMTTMEEKADDLASTGEAFFHTQDLIDTDLTEQVKAYLTTTFTKFPDAVGGGLWYEPNLFFKDQQYYGPYAYRDHGQVVFTWDLNTPEYDYHNQDWYRLAIPKYLDTSMKRPERIYWTDPYIDQAGTQALMITVDVLMYDQNRIIGMSTLDFSLESLTDRISKIQLSENSFAFVVDTKNNQFLAYPPDSTLQMQPVDTVTWGHQIPNTKSIASGEFIQKSFHVDGKDYFMLYHINPNSLGIGILIPEEELYAVANKLATRDIYVAIILILFQIFLFIMTSLMLTKMIIKPLISLSIFSSESKYSG